MRGAEQAGPCLSEMAPGELERLAHGHVDRMLADIQAAGARIKADYHPLAIARRHPVAAVAAAGAAGLLLVRLLRSSQRGAGASLPQGGAASQSLNRTFANSLLSAIAGAAGRALPGLVLSWSAHQQKSEHPGPKA
jgi:ABC-type Fe3+ transport system permease subunit